MKPSEFLQVLGLSNPTFQTFADRPGGQNLSRVFQSASEGNIKTLRNLNHKYAGVFFMVNQGDGKGRKNENVIKVSSFFADLDGVPLLDEYPLTPTMTVESSPKRYHLYWKVTDAPLEAFSHVQENIAILLGSDPKVKDKARVMRLPGFYHCKGKPFLSKVIDCTGLVYSYADILEYFNVPAYNPVPRLPQAAQAFVDKKFRGKSANGYEGNAVKVATAPQGQRNETLFKNACAVAHDIAAGEIGKEDALDALFEAGLAAGLDEAEIRTTLASAMRYANVN
jgi:hypothetical protein